MATLRVVEADIAAGERPELMLVLTNRGRERLRLPDSAGVGVMTSVRAFDADGQEMRPREVSTIDRYVFPTSVQRLLALAPGRSREFSVSNGPNLPDALPVGDYSFTVTYRNWAGAPVLYDVRERGAEAVWTGELTTSVNVRVHPLDLASEQRLIEQVREGDRTTAETAIRVLGLSRTAAAVDAIVERFERDSSYRVVFESLGHIATPHAVRALAAAHTGMPNETVRFLGQLVHPDDIRRLVRAGGCEALALSSLIPPRLFAADLRSVCPEIVDLLRTEILLRDKAQPLTQAEAQRQEWAVSMLKSLELPAPPPPPTVFPHDEFPSPPAAERLTEYVNAIVGFPDGHSENVDVELSGIAQFGTHETFAQLRSTLSTVPERSAYVISKALEALTFQDEAVPAPARTEELRRWDAWWRQHGRRSREQWARDAIAKRPTLSTGLDAVTGSSRAAEYLLVLDRQQYERALVTHASWRVRVTAAVTLAASDPQYAASLLLRELENRYPSACFNAGNQLASLTGTWFPFHCSSLQERRSAAAHWTREALALR